MMHLILERVPDQPNPDRAYRVVDERSREVYGEGYGPDRALHAAARQAESERWDLFHTKTEMDHIDRSDALLRAARAVEDVVADLDAGSSGPCTACTRPVYRNLHEHKAAKDLRAVAERLRRMAASPVAAKESFQK